MTLQQKALRALSYRFDRETRLIAILRYVDGLTVDETADVLGLASATVVELQTQALLDVWETVRLAAIGARTLSAAGKSGPPNAEIAALVKGPPTRD
jgi:hypothetical protein